jgi:hypothetical protein
VRGVQLQYRPRTMRSLAIVKTGRESSSALSPVLTIERLQMAQDYFHQPVLVREITELFAGQSAGVIIDATLGGAGHSAILLRAAPQVRILGIDRDPDARAAAGERLAEFPERFLVVDATFAELADVVASNAHFIGDEPIVGILMDLGVSSYQLDESSRGFSFPTRRSTCEWIQCAGRPPPNFSPTWINTSSLVYYATTEKTDSPVRLRGRCWNDNQLRPTNSPTPLSEQFPWPHDDADTWRLECSRHCASP